MSSTPTLTSNRAFILAIAGAAIGLGNIWRFPYLAGENGGSAFLLIYIACLVLLGLPVMVAEISIGRAGQASPAKSLAKLAANTGASKHWAKLALLGCLIVFMILSFYSVVAGWAMHYLQLTFSQPFAGQSAAELGQRFNEFLADPVAMIIYHTMFMVMTMAVSAAGVVDGLEMLNRRLMPVLYLLLIAMAAYAMTMPGFGQALEYLFKPDFSRVDLSVVLSAMGQAFFSLAVGACCLMAYGAYMPRQQSLLGAASAVCVMVFIVAVLSGIAIFSIVFSKGLDPSSGPGLMFVTLPLALENLAWGQLATGTFFLLLVIATWTSSINLAEPMVLAVAERFSCSRKRAALLVGVGVWLMGLVSVFSFNIWADVKPLPGKGLFDLVTGIPTDLLLPVGGLLIAIFAGFVLHKQRLKEQLSLSQQSFRFWYFQIRYIAPTLVFIVLASTVKSYIG